MTGPFRLRTGGAIDRTRPLPFTFDGKALTGYSGDTLASALLASGVSVVGRSFKFHRPRGVLTAGLEEPNALLTVGQGALREPSARATTQTLYPGLVAQSQNCWPSLSFDLGRINDVLHRVFAAGFYNKTFLWPSWHAFEPIIRRMAGLGIAPKDADPDRYEWRNAHCDVLVVGGGISGLLAAWLAGQSGARVILLESDRVLGGRLNWERANPGALAPELRLREIKAAISQAPTIRILLGTTAVGAYDHGLVTALERRLEVDSSIESPRRERWWRIRAKQVILASGAFEQPVAFPFNDRPGIMLADAVRHYLNRYAVAAGQRIAIVTNNDSAYALAADLRAAGVQVPCVLDVRNDLDARLTSATSALGITVHRGAQLLDTRGERQVDSVRFRSSQSSRAVRVACDAVAMSGGWNPIAHLYCQAGGRLRFDGDRACLVPDGRMQGMHAVGASAAHYEPRTAVAHVLSTVTALLQRLNLEVRSELPSWAAFPQQAERGKTGAIGYSAAAHRERVWLDFQHDVTASDIDLAVRENLVSVEHVKRYTTVGMSVDQGKTSNLNALAVLAERTQRAIADVGTTTFRPFFVPVTLGAIAGGRNGRFYRPTRLLPAHTQHEALGAHFQDYGSWKRPGCYPQARESHTDAIAREVHALRTGVGLFDASPLGKFWIQGPDAAEFLNRMYANTIQSLQPGKVRYGILLNEKGVIFDDGVCARLGVDKFWVNSTGSGAAYLAGWFDEWLQGEWPDLQVVTTDVTSAFATINLAGPKARDVLASLPCDVDLSRDAFPHLQVRSGTLCGVPCQILRVSFTGELSYEISVPADYGASLWERLYEAGQPFGLVPFGVESLLVARTEKGYLHVGADTDGSTVPDDIGFGKAVANKVGDFVGRRSLSLPENLRLDRLQLVGLRCKGDSQAFNTGAHLTDAKPTQLPAQSAGYLTSACWSPTLNAHVGLGLLRGGRSRLGETVYLVDGQSRSEAEVVNASHYDPVGARLND
jgi:sarcosine oxidase subunit alpha